MSIKSIQVLGSGCPTCKKLLEDTKKVAQELNIKTTVEYVTDVSKMIEMGVMAGPVLAVDNKPILTGGRKSEDDIRRVLQDNFSAKSSCDGSSCGCNCC